ncbi:hypothetical protein KIN20_006767 [Parelaphostrongylus tenuis]|uniref:Uncharacterized protein n=1 Tax=Parelaphostrongylus tenuis TaxID=148309 RepID=A0AAD5QLA3_PARTN|nr:hypothetical protein KIN20_006767 [Parelaphostrongylus tenuis]
MPSTSTTVSDDIVDEPVDDFIAERRTEAAQIGWRDGRSTTTADTQTTHDKHWRRPARGGYRSPTWGCG